MFDCVENSAFPTWILGKEKKIYIDQKSRKTEKSTITLIFLVEVTKA